MLPIVPALRNGFCRIQAAALWVLHNDSEAWMCSRRPEVDEVFCQHER